MFDYSITIHNSQIKLRGYSAIYHPSSKVETVVELGSYHDYLVKSFFVLVCTTIYVML